MQMHNQAHQTGLVLAGVSFFFLMSTLPSVASICLRDNENEPTVAWVCVFYVFLLYKENELVCCGGGRTKIKV